ncbi:MAG: nucleotide excision repair endonuclease [Chitinophagaceae bacterium]|nr:nucleotide excision repair endonuclease [Oligoflexus sp.]
MNLEFDQKLGVDFLSTVPTVSGIYVFRDDKSQAIYVGKAKNLKRRLSQYRLASRKKAARKMRTIVRLAVTLEFRICASETEALLLENELILLHKPKLNISGAFSFLYPYLGFKWEAQRPKELALCYTTSPDILTSFQFHLFGAYRSRLVVREAFEALSYIMAFIGHHTPAERKQYGDIPYTRIICFRQVDSVWKDDLQAFFRGESLACLERLFVELLEKPDARQLASEIQEHLKNLKSFFRYEASTLRSVLQKKGIDSSMIRQEDRDRLFISLA